jgi:hypothetical protein
VRSFLHTGHDGASGRRERRRVQRHPAGASSQILPLFPANTALAVWRSPARPAQKGGAVVSETLNSNTINIVVGIELPAVIFGVKGDKPIAVVELWWLLGLTAVAVLLAAFTGGLTRKTGIAIICLYFVFVAMRIYLQ